MSTQACLEKFQNFVEVIEHCGGSIGTDLGAVEQVLGELSLTRDTATQDEITAAVESAKERYLAVAFILGSERSRLVVSFKTSKTVTQRMPMSTPRPLTQRAQG